MSLVRVKLLVLLSAGLLCAGLPGRADMKAGTRIPVPTAANQYPVSAPYGAGFVWTPVTLPWLSNGSQTAFGGAIDTTSRLSVNPQGTSENGLTVNLPSGVASSEYAFQVKDSTGNQLAGINAGPNVAISGLYTGSSILYLRRPGVPSQYLALGNSSGQPFIFTGGTAISFDAPFFRINGTTNPNDASPPLNVFFVSNGGSTYANTTDIATFRLYGATGPIGAHVLAGGAFISTGYVSTAAIATPTGLALTTFGTAGTTTYAYRVSALSGTGETLACSEVTIGTGNATLSASNYNTLNWSYVPGAEKYVIYGRTAGAEQKLVTQANFTYNDVGGATPSGSLPTTNATGYVNAALYQAGGTPGITVTVPLAKLTAGGTNGSLTYTGGILTSSVSPT